MMNAVETSQVCGRMPKTARRPGKAPSFVAFILLLVFAIGSLAFGQELDSGGVGGPGGGAPPQGGMGPNGGGPQGGPGGVQQGAQGQGQPQQGASSGQQQGSAQGATRANANDYAAAQNTAYYALPKANSETAGEPLSLERALYGAYSAQDRLRRLLAYWDLSCKYAQYNLAEAHGSRFMLCFNKVVQKYGGSDSVPAETQELLLALRQVALEKLSAAKLNFLQTQLNFDAAFSTPAGRVAAAQRAAAVGRQSGIQNGAVLYIPSTIPSSESYSARFAEIARVRNLSGDASRVNAMLPLLYDTMQARANQALRASAAFTALYNGANTSDDALFTALDAFTAAQKEALIAQARYNQAIASYAAMVAPGYLQGDSLLATLNLRASSRQTFQQTGGNGAPAGQGGQQNSSPAPAGQGGQQSPNGQPPQRPQNRTTFSSWNDLRPGILSDDDYAPAPLADASALAVQTIPAENLLSSLDIQPIQPSYQLIQTSYSSGENTATLANAGYVAPAATPVQEEAPATQEQPVSEPVAQTEPEPAQSESAQPATAPAAEEPKPSEETAQEPPKEESRPEEPKTAPPEPPKDDAKPAPPEPPKDEPKPEPPKEPEKPAPTVAVVSPVIPTREPANVVVITGYEQFESPDPAPREAGNGEKLLQNQQSAPDGAFFMPVRSFLLASLMRGLTAVFAYDGDIADEPVPERIIRGQEPRQPVAGDAQRGAPQNGALVQNGQSAEAAQNALFAKRASDATRALFAIAAPNPNAQTEGEEERLFSLQEALQRAGASSPDARIAVAVAYWRLHGAVARQRVEETVYQNFASLYDQLRRNSSSKLEQCAAALVEAQARVAEAKTLKRSAQVALMHMMGLTSETSAYPLPSTQPFCGMNYDLGSTAAMNAQMRRTAGVIQERLKAIQKLGGNFASVPSILGTDLSNASDANLETVLATLAGKREQALLFVDQIVALNSSIAEYVAYYPVRVSNDRYAEALVGRGS